MRLDNFLVEKSFFETRTKAKQAIERGEIYINDKVVKKVSFEVKDENSIIKRICKESFVSLGGFKLKKALEDFNYQVNELICADIGSSTGGFTDCLLQCGAKKVYAVDLNDELLHNSLKEDEKVVPIIKNCKNLIKADFNENLDLIVADLSFISVTQAIPVLANLLEEGKNLLILIKPQFETGEKIKFKNGVIRDKKIQLNACFKAYDCAIENSLAPIKFTTAPLNGDKNLEFLMLLEKNGKDILDKNKIIF